MDAYPAPPPPVSPELIWTIYNDLAKTEQHFNGLQAQYRVLASTWLLAAFGATGFVLSTSLQGVPAAPVVAGIGLAASAVICLLWMLDLLVYHRLLDAAFVEALQMERLHPWLPKVRTNMWDSQKGRGVRVRVRLFYLIGVLLTSGGGLVALILWAMTGATWGFTLAAGWLLGVIVVAGYLYAESGCH